MTIIFKSQTNSTKEQLIELQENINGLSRVLDTGGEILLDTLKASGSHCTLAETR